MNYNNRVIAALSLALLAVPMLSVCAEEGLSKPKRKGTCPPNNIAMRDISSARVRQILNGAAKERNGIKPGDGRADLQQPFTAEPPSYTENNNHRQHSSQTTS